MKGFLLRSGARSQLQGCTCGRCQDDPERWDEFKRRYSAELAGRSDALRGLRQRAHRETVTLLFAARDEHRNNAVVVREFLRNGDQPTR